MSIAIPLGLREPSCTFCGEVITLSQQATDRWCGVSGAGVFHVKCATALMVQLERAVESALNDHNAA